MARRKDSVPLAKTPDIRTMNCTASSSSTRATNPTYWRPRRQRRRQRRGSERHMAREQSRLKLGKRAALVKTRLKQLPQKKETWEADFRALPKPRSQTETHYLGIVVALPKGDPLVYLPVEYTPNVNDLADLLADAMRRPLTGSARRPEHVHFRGNPRWE